MENKNLFRSAVSDSARKQKKKAGEKRMGIGKYVVCEAKHFLFAACLRRSRRHRRRQQQQCRGFVYTVQHEVIRKKNDLIFFRKILVPYVRFNRAINSVLSADFSSAHHSMQLNPDQR